MPKIDTTTDPFRLAEWAALPNDTCFISGCDTTETDQRGPVFLRDGSIHKACPEHWEPIHRVLGEQVTWKKDAMRGQYSIDGSNNDLDY